MKTLGSILLGFILAFSASAETYLSPTNPPPWVGLAWDASPSTNASGYWVYYGAGSRQYTNKVEVGTNLTAKVEGLQRGVRYYFAVTAHDRDGLESDFSNEVSWRPNLPPAPPAMKSVIVLTVQSKPAASGAWADAPMDWSIPPDKAGELYRLKMLRLPQVATAAPRAAVKPPPVKPPPVPSI